MKKIHAYDWLLFDADGTLFDFELAEITALAQTFDQKGLHFNQSNSEIYHRINKQVWKEFEQQQISAVSLRTRRFDLLIEALALDSKLYSAEDLSTSYLRHLGQQGQMIEGALALLTELAGEYHLGLITNGLRDVQRARLAQSGISNLFQVIAISEEIGAAKPHQAYFDTVFKWMGSPPRDRVLVIGDSLSSDIAGGNQYQLDTCWYNPHRQTVDLTSSIKPTCEIHNLNQLIDLLLK